MAEEPITACGGILAAPRRHPRMIAAAALAAALLAGAIVFVSLRGSAAASPLATLTDPGHGGTSVGAFSSGGTVAALVGDKGVIYIWDVPAGRLIATLAGAGANSGTAMAFSPDDAMLAVAGDGTTAVWDVRGARRVATVTGPGGSTGAADTGGVLSVAFSPGGRTLAVGDGDGSSYLWDLTTWRLAATLTDPGSMGVAAVAFSPGGTLLAAGDSNGQVDVWNVATSRRIAVYTDGEGVTSVAFSPDSRTLATDHCLWDIATAKRRCLARGQAFAAFHRDGRALAFGFGQNGSITVWPAG